MYHLCTTAIFRAIYHKRKTIDIQLNINGFRLVGVTRFELATTRPPQRRNLFFPIKVINFILVYLHHVQIIAILTYCHLLRFFLYHFCTTIYFTSGNDLLCSHRSTEIQAQFNGVSHSPIMRHQK